MDEHERGKGGQHIEIVVNGRAKPVDHSILTFDEVVALAYPTPPEAGDIVYLVVYHNADQEPRNHSLVAPNTVKVRKGTRFDVKHTVRS